MSYTIGERVRVTTPDGTERLGNVGLLLPNGEAYVYCDDGTVVVTGKEADDATVH